MKHFLMLAFMLALFLIPAQASAQACGECVGCYDEELGWGHEFTRGGSLKHQGNLNHACGGQNGCNSHPYCLEPDPDAPLSEMVALQTLLYSFDSLTGDQLGEIVAATNGKVFFNSERGALQRLDCDRVGVSGHFPLSTAQLLAFTKPE